MIFHIPPTPLWHHFKTPTLRNPPRSPISDLQHSRPLTNSSTGVDYEPHPKNSRKVYQKYDEIVKAICRLYSGSAGEQDMQVYAEKAIYDDPWSYCDSRYKIAGQWRGMYLHPFRWWVHMYACYTSSVSRLASAFGLLLAAANHPSELWSRHTKNHGLLAHPQDGNHLLHSVV